MSGKILVVDDQQTNRMILRAMLEMNFYTVIEACDGLEAIEAMKNETPDLILMDVSMPEMDGFDACKIIKGEARTASIPIVMVTASDNHEERHMGLESGADDFLSKPVNQRVLFARIRNLLRVKHMFDELQMRRETASSFFIDSGSFNSNMELPRANILLIFGEVEEAAYHKAFLQSETGHNFDIESSEAGGLAQANSNDYDAFIISEKLADEGMGLRLIASINADWKNRNKVIILLADNDIETGLRSLELGANDYMVGQHDPTELIVRLNTQLRRMFYADQLRNVFEKQLRMSVIDPLTDLHNRRYLEIYLPKILARASETKNSFAVMMLDLDKFKSLNDTYGHDFGDIVLTETARRLKENLRAADLIVRYGGEEFVVIAPGVDHDLASEIAERLRVAVEGKEFITSTRETVSVTTSIGVTVAGHETTEITSVLKSADEALYRAKTEGRNQVIFSAA